MQHEIESVKIFDEILDETISPSKKFDKNLKTVREVFEFFELMSDELDLIKSLISNEKNEKNYLYQVFNHYVLKFFFFGGGGRG